MIAEHINPFLTSLANTMQTMLGCSLQRGKLIAPYESAWGPLTLEFGMTPMKVNA